MSLLLLQRCAKFAHVVTFTLFLPKSDWRQLFEFLLQSLTHIGECSMHGKNTLQLKREAPAENFPGTR
jgi:hypothetical protein